VCTSQAAPIASSGSSTVRALSSRPSSSRTRRVAGQRAGQRAALAPPAGELLRETVQQILENKK